MKRIDLLIGACNKLGRRLLTRRRRPEERRLKAMAEPIIEFLGRFPARISLNSMQNAGRFCSRPMKISVLSRLRLRLTAVR